MELIGFFIGVAFFIALEGFFAGSEIALLSADKGALRAVLRKKRYSFVAHFLENPEEYITLTMLGYTVSIVFAATLYTLALMSATKYLPGISGYEVLLAETLVIFTIIFGEIIPKSFFQHYANKLVIPSLFVLDKFRIPLKPFLVLAKVISRAISSRFARTHVSVRREDIIELLREKKTFAEYEGLVVSNILSFKDRRVGEIVKPLYEIVMIAENTNVAQAVEKIKESGYSRIPVYRVRVDDIVGYVSAYDLLDAQPEEPLRGYIRKILVFSEYTPLPEVISEFKKRKEHIGVVVDERGVIIGIVTLEDILREIVGSIQTDKGEEELIREISKDVWIADGKLELNELARITGVKIPEGNYSTLGGFLSYLAGRIPKEGETFKVENFMFKVVSKDNRKVKKVLVEKLSKEEK
ncbi:CBS domain containing-hemolysin-like protein [Hydrogenivirga caldilitoris]|uniref:CBS domain containing-hemolysin-like protein n=1 Tax=Hydrogenivirga caldilitoris TaxID=246264 RepID=A0A497XQ64_9AQUI|nr:hemolysin family protein [Hydrogenivirga caldilitoris]RLJ70394.1 CBS domain containing-hemolysin-like protein [Hydrogenivirga caldilitoris]